MKIALSSLSLVTKGNILNNLYTSRKACLEGDKVFGLNFQIFRLWDCRVCNQDWRGRVGSE